jgi:addiction module HigA family antidote
MGERKRKPTHPGGIIKRHYLEPLNLTISEVAADMGIARKTLSKIVNERGSVTPDMALRLAKAFNTSPELWLNLQMAHDLWVASQKSAGLDRIKSFVPV